ncbi:MAG TPA: bifunctional DNA-binding transcriptional regulator/O6-methylguanine-DNA methyltransferase Ada [Candidatus Angelobacter sp.]|jgi:AraC family transcriptional regulator of adaptative response/methylated-DNA-[protein]-cysteine methyltransferase
MTIESQTGMKSKKAHTSAVGVAIKHSQFLTDEERWNAIVRRDPAADGSFYYSVRTTGVYCRPSCPARLARQENVRFHLTGQSARDAGFRPCKRCRPEGPCLTDRRKASIAKACSLIEAADESVDGGELAIAVSMSRFHFHRIFKEITGLTPKQYATAHRAKRLRSELSTSATVTEAIYRAGYNSSSRFYTTASKVLGMTPSDFRARGANSNIHFCVGECSLGSILVGVTGKGICAILLGDDPDALVRDLQNRFSNAKLVGGDAEIEAWMARVVGFVEAPGIGLDLPLDVRGTAFQQRVWQALTKVPIGSTTSYAEIAEQMGSPRAVRAVAQACAANALAVAIPCHRVVRSDGSLSGYRWGIERKRELLNREAKS